MTVKRLAPTWDVLRELHLKSGNICAFPGCDHLLINAEGVFIAQLCHIEAAETLGPRFNDQSSNEARRAFENLMLMCHEHHKVTDDVHQFPVAKLQQMKRDHERRFSDPARAITLSLKDWTVDGRSFEAKNLRKMSEVLGWSESEEDLDSLVSLVNKLIGKLKVTPHDVRQFLCALLKRAARIKSSGAVKWNQGRGSIAVAVVATDIESAFNLSRERLLQFSTQLEEYGLGGADEIAFGEMDKFAVYLTDLDGWNFWESLVQFCAKESLEVDTIVYDLSFERLDVAAQPQPE